MDVASNEVFTYHKEMKEVDAEMFIAAMQKEIFDHDSRNHRTIVHQSTLTLSTKNIQEIWSFKRKRFPDGSLNKHKARICAHGGMQEWGANYWETYSPVVNMLTVRLLLALCNIHKLESNSIDFVLAFPQADLDVEIWMELPIGFVIDEAAYGECRSYVLKLNKNLYGLKQASLNSYDKLCEGPIARYFVPSVIGPSFHVKYGMMILT